MRHLSTMNVIPLPRMLHISHTPPPEEPIPLLIPYIGSAFAQRERPAAAEGRVRGVCTAGSLTSVS
jgi:hypothetical protein